VDLVNALIAADNAGDVDTIASFYAEDAVLLPPAAAPVRGREAIRGRYEEGFARFELKVSLRSEGTRISETSAFSYGTTSGEYVWRDGSPPTPFHDTYLMALERDSSGAWHVAALMWSPFDEKPSATEGGR